MNDAAQTKTDQHPKTFTIIVNGREKKVTQHVLTFSDIVALAFPNVPPDPNIIFTVTYSKGDKHGTLVAGQSIATENGMVFNVTQTNKS